MHQQPTTSGPSADAEPPADATIPLLIGAVPSEHFTPSPPPLYTPPGHAAFRLLCHASRVGGLIGKSGSTIKHLQQITNSKIRVHDPADPTDHRVITVVASTAISKKIRISNSSSTTSSTEEEIQVGNGGTTGVGDDECFDVSAAQEGVLRVFERVVEVAVDGEVEKEREGDAVPAIGVVGMVSCRLLAWKNQAGAVIGKGGKVVERIRKETGCRVKVLASDKYLPRSSPLEEIVEIEGNFLAVRKALVAVTGRLQEFPPLEKSRIYGTRSPVTEPMPIPSVDPPPQQTDLLQQMHSNSMNHASGGSLQSLEAEEVSSVGSRTPKLEVVFKILCPNEKVGSIIGKGGSIIKALEKETGASINFGPVLAGCDDRLITITAAESVESQNSPAQNAAVLVFNRSMVAGLVKGLDSCSKGPVSARVAVPSSQVDCLLGKGGSIISKMRKETGAGLRIVRGDQLPKCVSQNDEVVQIEGNFLAVRKALVAVTSRLQEFQPLEKSRIYGTRSVVTEPMPIPSVDPPPQQTDLLQQMHSNSMNHASGGSLQSLEAEEVSSVDSRTPKLEVVFKILCPNEKVGSIIGKGGSIIKALEKETGASINFGPVLADCDDRLITITATESVESQNSPAQNAAVLVFNRSMAAGLVQGLDSCSKGPVSARVALPSSQVGCLLGKGGAIISKIRKETGAGLRIVRGDQLPKCVSQNDEVLQIEGNFLAVRKAFVSVTSHLQEFPPLEKSRIYGTRSLVTEPMPIPSVDPPPQQTDLLQQVHSNSMNHASGGSLQSLEAEEVSSVDRRTPKLEVVFKILCPNEKVGSIIGKGGSIVKALEKETGASINFGPVLADCYDQLITITAAESVESQNSPAQNAAVLVFNRSMVAGLVKGLDSCSKGPVSARVAVPSSQVDCLLGKGGAIISKMRKETGAGLRIVQGDQLPKCVSQNDEVVQITGEIANVQDALYKVTSRLRMNVFSMKMSVGGRNSSSRIESGAYSGVSDMPSSGSHLSLGILENVNEHKCLTNNSTDHRGIFNCIDRPHSPSLLSTRQVSSVNQENIMDTSQRLHLVKGVEELTISGGSRSAIVTNTTVEIVVSDNVIGSIYGENGSNLARLREISGAVVTVHEVCPGTTQRTVVLSGTPDQTRAAQSLLQAFILTAAY